MRSLTLLPLIPAFVLPLAGCMPGASVSPRDLSAEFRKDPAGLHTTKPRLAWSLDASEPGGGVSAYRVIAARSPEDLGSARNLVWDTGMVSDKSPATTLEYAGKALGSRSKVWWKVEVWDQDGRESGWSTPASFSVGLLDQGDWNETTAAEWIGLDAAPTAPLTQQIRDQVRSLPFIRQPGGPEREERETEFSGSFSVKSDAVTEAWFAGSVDQLGSMSVNNGPSIPLTRWDLLKAIDVKGSLKTGQNSVRIEVHNEDGFNPAASGMFVIRYADGSEQRVPLDKSWTFGPVGGAGERKAVEESRGQPWGGNRNIEHFMPPAPYLRTTFTTMPGKRIARATLYSTALGVYEPRLNGARVGRDELTPGWTEFSKRVYHQTYDVTSMVTQGQNCLGAVLGDGWYAGLMGYTGKRRLYGGPARFKARLEITYVDGSTQVVATGPDWVGSFGPILHTDNYIGSGYDARLEMPGWDTAGFNTGTWQKVHTGLAQGTNLREFDVTAKIAEIAKNPGRSLKVGPDTLGEPCFNVQKTLRIDYTVGGQAKHISLKENEFIGFPRPGETGEVVITKAIFGEPPPPPAPPMMIEPQPGEPVRRFEELPAKSVSEPRPGRYVFDLAQNMVGWTRIKVNGKAGQRLTIRHAEMLNPDGTLYTANLRGATATDFITLKDGWQTIEPPFTFHGFQYVEISGLTSKPSKDMVTGIVVHTDMTPVGTFSCSNPLVNQLVHNIVWGQKGNYLEVPTDCPQRDERLGWTGDAQFFINAAAFNFDIASFMSRWLKTLNHDAQFEDGTFAHVAPKVNERGGSTAWGDAAIVCTHALYWTYGDTRIIAENYEPMCKYMRWLDSKTTDGIAKVGGFGDWVNLGDPTSSDLIDTAQRIQLLGSMTEMARVIGKASDAEKFAAARTQSINAFRARFLALDGSLKDSGQTGYAMAFTIPGILPEETRAKTADHFVRTIEKKNWHLATGFIGTPRLLPALFAAGKDGVAHRLLLTETFPSWLYQVKLGATTMWERWDGWTPDRGFQDVGMNSFNHYAFGAVGDALYRHVAGISALEPGYKRVLIEPRPDLSISPAAAPLTNAKASYRSISGTISSSWNLVKDQGMVYDITIPPGTTAEIRLRATGEVLESGKPIATVPSLKVLPETTPGVVRIEAPAGTYHFVTIKRSW